MQPEAISDAMEDPRPRRVLLAVDGATVGTLTRALFERLGYEVSRIRCDATAIDGLSETRFDLAAIEAAARGAEAMAAACSSGFAYGPVPVLSLAAPRSAIQGAAAHVPVPVTMAALKAAVDTCRRQAETAAWTGIDMRAIAELWGGIDSPGFAAVAKVFLTELDQRIDRLTDALADGRHEDVELHAHAIKGAATSVGATAINAAAAELESHANGDAADRRARFDLLMDAARRGAPALRAILDRSAI